MPPMSTISIQRLNSEGFVNGHPIRHSFPRIAASWTMTMRDPKNFSSGMKNTMEDLSMQLSISTPPAHKVETLRSGDLRFDRLQPSDHELVGDKILEFGQFVARDAVLDEEYWTAAWLRAESHCENPTLARHDIRHIHNYKMRFADQEFNALKKRCQMQNEQKCTCIIAVKKEHKNVKRPILKSVVGTLDLNIRYLLQGETFPGERVKAPRFCSIDRTAPSRYGYIANVCVAKSARRQGIASNMLYYAVASAKTNGVEQVFVHVDRNNTTAQNLYQKIGFEMVDMANSQLSKEQLFLLRLQT
ncbi:uncharacterized protein LOC114711247 isoform X2 [Neltuma alba]|uniref:uncharacterized protein LOC114711247 isoform X2 n=1 Tax=Neltuma alba TaxID=207710 RepID=UPI0010A4822A|nr:uncharacterized protein LOC114711247 isoform X2 [Prosopis alba]